MNITELIERVASASDLTQTEARLAAQLLVEDATDAQIGALLCGLRTKGETGGEIAGFAEGMRDAANRIDPDRTPLVDTCGTGGDAHDTINVSTTSAIVVAGAGIPVAKHGNYSVSSASGSADVLEALGVTIDAEPSAVERAIERDGIGFMFAPVFHPAMAAVAGPRAELRTRTIFNVLGPLTNPAGADAQVVGVYDPSLVPVLAQALARMDVERALVVHGDGTDEVAVHGTTVIAEVDGDRVSTDRIDPDDLGLESATIEDVAGGTPGENAADLCGIVDGTIEGPKRNVVLANAGAAIYVAGGATDIESGVDRARDAIDSGAAAETLQRLQGDSPDHVRPPADAPARASGHGGR